MRVWTPTGTVVRERVALFETRVAVPRVTAAPGVALVISRKVMLPFTEDAAAREALSWPAPYGMVAGALRVRAPGDETPRPAMVVIVVFAAGCAVSWRMRWLPVSERVRRLAGESEVALGLSSE